MKAEMEPVMVGVGYVNALGTTCGIFNTCAGLFRAKQTAQVSRLSARPSGKKRLQQPGGFVASGCLNDAEPEGVVVVNPLANRHQGRQHNPPSHGALGATLPGNSEVHYVVPCYTPRTGQEWKTCTCSCGWHAGL